MNSSTKLAHSVIRDLIEVGVSNFVTSPGSRNAPLLIALNEDSENYFFRIVKHVSKNHYVILARHTLSSRNKLGRQPLLVISLSGGFFSVT